MQDIVLDTNFLLIPAQFRVDIFTELDRIIDFPHRLCILDKTLDELENSITLQKGKEKDAAKLAKKLIENKKIHIIKTDKLKNVDQILLETAAKEGFIVATQDIKLKQRLKTKGIRIITLRKKTHLTIED